MSVTTDVPDYLLAALSELGYVGASGLVTAAEEVDAGPRDYVWRDLREKVGLDAAFFSDGIPLIGFTGTDNPANLSGIRRKLWNYGRVPVLIAASPDSKITAYNAVSLTSRTDADTGVLAQERRAGTAYQLMSAFRRAEVESGRFAAQYASAYGKSERVDAALLNNLQYLRSRASAPGTPERVAIDALIGGSLTATYLAQRGILSADYLMSTTGYSDLEELLASGQSAWFQLFRGLTEHFNGDVFGPLPGVISSIDETVLDQIASLLRGDDLITGQQSLWPYDFRVLPADLVSSIYEKLLEETRHVDAAYYTPRFLVNTLLDEAIPWTGSNQPTIADLACGSGAFMTEAFRRLCYRERKLVGRELSYKELEVLLVDHIYGIDRNLGAARTAVFGLYLALLEELDPPTAWTTAVLPPLLGTNVIVSDAFDDNPLSERRFDVVVGNPPWGSGLSGPGAEFVKRSQVPVADKQVAAGFLWLAARMLLPGGTLALLMPAKALLHNRSGPAKEFRRAVFTNLNVRVIADLSAIRHQIFKDAVGPAAMIVADVPGDSIGKNSRVDELLYLSAHPRPLSGTVDALIIAPEEIRTVSVKQAQTRPEIWATLLWGGPRDIELLDRLRTRYQPLEVVATSRQWVWGQGFQRGGGDRNDATHLAGLPIVPTRAVLPLHVMSYPSVTFDLPYLHRPRNEALYKGPHILIRRGIVQGRIAAAFMSEDAIFPNGLIGIAGPSYDAPLLEILAGILSSSLAYYCLFMTSASWGTERDFVELNEYLSLPLAVPDRAQAEEFQRLFRTMRRGNRVPEEVLPQLDELVFELYQLDTEAKRRVRNFAVNDLPRFLHGQAFSAPATNDWLNMYADALTQALREALPDLRVNTTIRRHVNYCTATVALEQQNALTEPLSEGRVEVDPESIIARQLERNEYSTGVVAQPAGFFVDQDTIYLVKTADGDRWSRDAAQADANRIFSALAFGSR